jgi:preprotein translocase SecE subunit
MAKDVKIKNDDKNIVKEFKVFKLLAKEYPIENPILALISGLIIILGVYLIRGDVISISVSSNTWFPFITQSTTSILIFSIFVTVVGVAGFVIAMYPYFKPSFDEMKKVVWPTGKTVQNHSSRVFGFILALALFFIFVGVIVNIVNLYIAPWLNDII